MVSTSDPKGCASGSEATVILHGKLDDRTPADIELIVCGQKHTFSSGGVHVQASFTAAGT